MKSPVSSHAHESREHTVSSGSRREEISRQSLQSRTQTANTENSGLEKRDFFAGQTSRYTLTLLAEMKRVAKRPFNILITGETGTGKTYAAREIHRRSARSKEPFMELNCANLPEQLVEAELFGYRKGAFTGADRDHKGLFEEADGGILLLDEIGDITPPVQSKLLRAIEEKQIKRLGTNYYRHCNVQIIAATSRNLTKMIEAGQFREDLYTRLGVLRIETAPLRSHREDIPALVAFYLQEAAGAMSESGLHSAAYSIDEGAMKLLCEYDYPGNIRALRNLIYELTSYINEGEAITEELVDFTLAKLNNRNELSPTSSGSDRRELYVDDVSVVRTVPESLLVSIAQPGDIILPLDVCVLRQGETFKQWAARAKRCSIEAARRSTGGRMEDVARRLGLTRGSLKSHLIRAKRALNEDTSER
jgi:transcriptional regulator with PAS, ATPase and Fis domain